MYSNRGSNCRNPIKSGYCIDFLSYDTRGPLSSQTFVNLNSDKKKRFQNFQIFRLYFAAARDGLFPRMFSLIQIKFLTPWPSLWITVSLLQAIYIFKYIKSKNLTLRIE